MVIETGDGTGADAVGALVGAAVGAGAIGSSTFNFTVGRGISGTDARDAGGGVAAGVAAAGAGAAVTEVDGAAPAPGSRRKRTVGRGPSVAAGFADGTPTFDVSFFTAGGKFIIDVSFFASDTGAPEGGTGMPDVSCRA